MAKIRGVKPEFWTDDAVVELSRDARLLFIGLWNYACDNGHLADKPRQIKMRILPADDDVSVEELLQELVNQGRISRSDGTIAIHRFAEHQKPHRTWWTTCDLPGCLRPDGHKTREDNRGPTVDQPGTNSGPTDEVRGGDVDVDGEVTTPRRSPERPIPEDWKPTTTHQNYAEEHSIDLPSEAFKFRNHAHANDRRQRNWNAAFSTWLAKAREYAPPKNVQQTRAARAHLPEAWQ